MNLLKKLYYAWYNRAYRAGYASGGKDEWEKYDFFEETASETRQQIARGLRSMVAKFHATPCSNLEPCPPCALLDAADRIEKNKFEGEVW